MTMRIWSGACAALTCALTIAATAQTPGQQPPSSSPQTPSTAQRPASTTPDANTESWTPPDVTAADFLVRVERFGIVPWLASDDSDYFFSVAGTAPPTPDTLPPTDPLLQSRSHRPGVASTDRTIDVTWSSAIDNQTGVDGFSYSWDTEPATVPDLPAFNGC